MEWPLSTKCLLRSYSGGWNYFTIHFEGQLTVCLIERCVYEFLNSFELWSEIDFGIFRLFQFEAHNFDIEINVDTTAGGPSATGKPILSSGLGLGKDGGGSGLGPIPTKRSLNLDDYKKKRGLI